MRAKRKVKLSFLYISEIVQHKAKFFVQDIKIQSDSNISRRVADDKILLKFVLFVWVRAGSVLFAKWKFQCFPVKDGTGISTSALLNFLLSSSTCGLARCNYREFLLRAVCGKCAMPFAPTYCTGTATRIKKERLRRKYSPAIIMPGMRPSCLACTELSYN